MQLNTARVLLTGASGGLGNALAQQLVQQGAHVLLAGRDLAKLTALQQSLGAQTSIILADLTSTIGIQALQKAAADFQTNVLINNAGVSAFGLLHQQNMAEVTQVLHTNLLAPIQLTHTLLPHLMAQPGATIVNIGSAFGSLPFPGFAAYSSAKAGLRGFSQSLRRELADTPVKVLHVSPRAIRTDLNSAAVNALNIALGNASDDPNLVAQRIVRALAQDHRDLAIGFPERLFAWLNGIAPRLIDLGLASKLATIKRHTPQTQPNRT